MDLVHSHVLDLPENDKPEQDDLGSETNDLGIDLEQLNIQIPKKEVSEFSYITTPKYHTRSPKSTLDRYHEQSWSGLPVNPHYGCMGSKDSLVEKTKDCPFSQRQLSFAFKFERHMGRLSLDPPLDVLKIFWLSWTKRARIKVTPSVSNEGNLGRKSDNYRPRGGLLSCVGPDSVSERSTEYSQTPFIAATNTLQVVSRIVTLLPWDIQRQILIMWVVHCCSPSAAFGIEKDLEIITSQTDVSRSAAEGAYMSYRGDIVNAIIDLTYGD